MKSTTDSLIGQLRSWFPWRRRRAAEALGRAGFLLAVEPLIRALRDWNPGVRRAAAEALGCLGDARALVPLVRRLADRETQVRQAAARSLAGSDAVRDAVRRVRALVRAEADGTPLPAPPAGAASVSLLHQALSGVPEGRRQVLLAEALLALDEEGNRLVQQLTAPYFRGEWCIQVLADLDEERAIGPLVRILCRRDDRHRMTLVPAAANALWMLSVGRETALARAALNQAVHMDLGLSLRRVGRLIEGSAEYSIASQKMRELLRGCGHRAVEGLLQALGLEHPNEARAVANLLPDFGAADVAEGVLVILTASEYASVQTVYLVWCESPLLWSRVVGEWAQVRAGVYPRLLTLLDDRNLWVRLWAADALGGSGATEALARFGTALQEPGEDARLAAAVGLSHRRDIGALPPLLRRLDAVDWGSRLVVATALSRLGAQAGPALARLRELQAAEPHPDARRVYREAGGRIEEALRGAPTELLAAGAPAGLGTELEAGAAPEGTGTEPMSGEPR